MPNPPAAAFWRCLALAACLLSSAAAGEQILHDPGIPDGELSVYTSACDTNQQKITETVNIRTFEGREVYVDTFRSPEIDRYLTVDKAAFKVLVTHTVRHGMEAEVESDQIVREKRPKRIPDDIRLCDFYGLRFLMRGYPFDKQRPIQVNMLNTQDEVTMKVRYLGTEPMEMMGKTVECVKLELGFTGIVGPFLSKTQIWYQKAPPHFMVCSQGSSEFNRKIKCLVKLVGYQPGPDAGR
jgi:hypothetical protein